MISDKFLFVCLVVSLVSRQALARLWLFVLVSPGLIWSDRDARLKQTKIIAPWNNCAPNFGLQLNALEPAQIHLLQDGFTLMVKLITQHHHRLQSVSSIATAARWLALDFVLVVSMVDFNFNCTPLAWRCFHERLVVVVVVVWLKTFTRGATASKWQLCGRVRVLVAAAPYSCYCGMTGV